jgi:hypothetical protein
MTFRPLITLALTAALVTPVLAQTAVDPGNVTGNDIVTTPLSDINVKKRAVPDVLQAAIERPYSLAGLKSCPRIQTAVRNLDAVLGDDIDAVQEKTRGEKRGNSAGNVAKSIVGSLIPFEGVIREISGANNNERRWQIAIYAGSVRRAFLKGVGLQKGCRYPARPASS